MIVQHNRFISDGDGNIQSQRRGKALRKNKHTEDTDHDEQSKKPTLRTFRKPTPRRSWLASRSPSSRTWPLAATISEAFAGSGRGQAVQPSEQRGNAEAEADPFLPDESGDGCLPRHEPQAGRLDGSGAGWWIRGLEGSQPQRITALKRYTPRKGAVPRIRCVSKIYFADRLIK